MFIIRYISSLPVSKALSFNIQIIGYPSIKVFRRGNEELDYWGDNNEEDITDFIESNVLHKPNEL